MEVLLSRSIHQTADLAGRLALADDGKVRWKLVWEFLEEYRWEPADIELTLLHEQPPPTGMSAGRALSPSVKRDGCVPGQAS
jgi:hypothetical protein